MPYVQANRIISIQTDLPPDTLLLQSFSGTEGISSLFRFQLDLLSESSTIGLESMIGHGVTLSVDQFDGTPRFYNGVISRFYQSGQDERFTHYKAEMVPWLWLLTRTADCRIFQNLTPPQIITQIFQEHGCNDFEDSLGSYNPREYCVQYRETDFNFVSRLMEQYGIFYFFRHAMGKHTLVLGDNRGAHPPVPKAARVAFKPERTSFEDVVSSWEIGQELRTGKYSLNDYNFKDPRTNLLSSETTIVSIDADSKREVYDYPGEYETKTQGQTIARVRIEEEEAMHLVATGAGNCRAFTSGYRFELTGHYRKELNQAYLLTEVNHVASVGDSYVPKDTPGPQYYNNYFTCTPYSVPFRPARNTPKPSIVGVQTATIVGKADEEIWVDEFSRVKVQFPWDRLGKNDENSSCWIRVSQPWAGTRWGAIWIPRVGQEVVVEFLEGDPDRPIITGSVYNADQMPPYTLPEHQTQSGIKSRSSKHGTPENFNEIRFEDKKGHEQLLIHAEQSMLESVEGSQTITVGGSRSISTGGEEKGVRHGDVKELIYKNHNLHVKEDDRNKIDGKFSFHVVKDSVMAVDGDSSISVLGKLLIDAKEITLQGHDKITLLVGGSAVVLDASGVTIIGTMVKLNPIGAVAPLASLVPAPDEPDEP